MSVPAVPTLMLRPKDLARVLALLRAHVPDAEVWAYGSRVSGDAHEASDLDLVLRDPRDPGAESRQLPALRAAFIDSDLPIRVDLMDWARLPAGFQREIERAHVVLQEGRT